MATIHHHRKLCVGYWQQLFLICLLLWCLPSDQAVAGNSKDEKSSEIETVLYLGSLLRRSATHALGTILQNHATSEQLTPQQVVIFRQLHKGLTSREISTIHLLPDVKTVSMHNNFVTPKQYTALFLNLISKKSCKTIQWDKYISLLESYSTNLPLTDFTNHLMTIKYPKLISILDYSLFNFFNDTVMKIKRNEIELTPSLLSGILDNYPFPCFLPGTNEALQHTVKILLNDNESLKEFLQKYTFALQGNVRTFILNILNFVRSKDSPLQPSDKLKILELTPFLKFETCQNLKPHFHIYINAPKNHYKLLLEMDHSDYPSDIIKARDNLVSAVKSKELDLAKYSSDFIPQNYGDDILSVLFAYLTSLSFAIPISNPTSSYVHTLLGHVKMKYINSVGGIFVPSTPLDIALLLDSFNSLGIDLAETNTQIYRAFQKDFKWQKVLKNFPYKNYKQPRTLFIAMVQTLLKSEEQIQLCNRIVLKYFLEKVQNALNPCLNIQCQNLKCGDCRNILLTFNINPFVKNASQCVRSEEHVMALPINVHNETILEDFLQEPLPDKSDSFQNEITENKPPKINTPLSIVETTTRSPTKTVLLPEKCSTNFNIDESIQLAIESILKYINTNNNGNLPTDLNLTCTDKDGNKLFVIVSNEKNFSTSNNSGRKPQIPSCTNSTDALWVDVPSLLKAVGPEVPEAALELVKNILTPERIHGFNITKYRTKGELLYELLLFSRKHMDFPPVIKNAVKIVLSNIHTNGPGALEPVLFCRPHTSIGDQLLPEIKNCTEGMKMIITFNIPSLLTALAENTPQQLKASITSYLKHPNISNYIQNLNISLTQSKAQILKEVLVELIAKEDKLKSVLKNALSFIQTEGEGMLFPEVLIKCINISSHIFSSPTSLHLKTSTIESQTSTFTSTEKEESTTSIVTSTEYDIDSDTTVRYETDKAPGMVSRSTTLQDTRVQSYISSTESIDTTIDEKEEWISETELTDITTEVPVDTTFTTLIGSGVFITTETTPDTGREINLTSEESTVESAEHTTPTTTVDLSARSTPSSSEETTLNALNIKPVTNYPGITKEPSKAETKTELDQLSKTSDIISTTFSKIITTPLHEITSERTNFSGTTMETKVEPTDITTWENTDFSDETWEPLVKSSPETFFQSIETSYSIPETSINKMDELTTGSIQHSYVTSETTEQSIDIISSAENTDSTYISVTSEAKEKQSSERTQESIHFTDETTEETTVVNIDTTSPRAENVEISEPMVQIMETLTELIVTSSQTLQPTLIFQKVHTGDISTELTVKSTDETTLENTYFSDKTSEKSMAETSLKSSQVMDVTSEITTFGKTLFSDITSETIMKPTYTTENIEILGETSKSTATPYLSSATSVNEIEVITMEGTRYLDITSETAVQQTIETTSNIENTEISDIPVKPETTMKPTDKITAESIEFTEETSERIVKSTLETFSQSIDRLHSTVKIPVNEMEDFISESTLDTDLTSETEEQAIETTSSKESTDMSATSITKIKPTEKLTIVSTDFSEETLEPTIKSTRETNTETSKNETKELTPESTPYLDLISLEYSQSTQTPDVIVKETQNEITKTTESTHFSDVPKETTAKKNSQGTDIPFETESQDILTLKTTMQKMALTSSQSTLISDVTSGRTIQQILKSSSQPIKETTMESSQIIDMTQETPLQREEKSSQSIGRPTDISNIISATTVKPTEETTLKSTQFYDVTQETATQKPEEMISLSADTSTVESEISAIPTEKITVESTQFYDVTQETTQKQEEMSYLSVDTSTVGLEISEIQTEKITLESTQFFYLTQETIQKQEEISSPSIDISNALSKIPVKPTEERTLESTQFSDVTEESATQKPEEIDSLSVNTSDVMSEISVIPTEEITLESTQFYEVTQKTATQKSEEMISLSVETSDVVSEIPIIPTEERTLESTQFYDVALETTQRKEKTSFQSAVASGVVSEIPAIPTEEKTLKSTQFYDVTRETTTQKEEEMSSQSADISDIVSEIPVQPTDKRRLESTQFSDVTQETATQKPEEMSSLSFDTSTVESEISVIPTEKITLESTQFYDVTQKTATQTPEEMSSLSVDTSNVVSEIPVTPTEERTLESTQFSDATLETTQKHETRSPSAETSDVVSEIPVIPNEETTLKSTQFYDVTQETTQKQEEMSSQSADISDIVSEKPVKPTDEKRLESTQFSDVTQESATQKPEEISYLSVETSNVMSEISVIPTEEITLESTQFYDVTQETTQKQEETSSTSIDTSNALSEIPVKPTEERTLESTQFSDVTQETTTQKPEEISSLSVDTSNAMSEISVISTEETTLESTQFYDVTQKTATQKPEEMSSVSVEITDVVSEISVIPMEERTLDSTQFSDVTQETTRKQEETRSPSAKTSDPSDIPVIPTEETTVESTQFYDVTQETRTQKEEETSSQSAVASGVVSEISVIPTEETTLESTQFYDVTQETTIQKQEEMSSQSVDISNVVSEIPIIPTEETTLESTQFYDVTQETTKQKQEEMSSQSVDISNVVSEIPVIPTEETTVESTQFYDVTQETTIQIQEEMSSQSADISDIVSEIPVIPTEEITIESTRFSDVTQETTIQQFSILTQETLEKTSSHTINISTMVPEITKNSTSKLPVENTNFPDTTDETKVQSTTATYYEGIETSRAFPKTTEDEMTVESKSTQFLDITSETSIPQTLISSSQTTVIHEEQTFVEVTKDLTLQSTDSIRLSLGTNVNSTNINTLETNNVSYDMYELTSQLTIAPTQETVSSGTVILGTSPETTTSVFSDINSTTLTFSPTSDEITSTDYSTSEFDTIIYSESTDFFKETSKEATSMSTTETPEVSSKETNFAESTIYESSSFTDKLLVSSTPEITMKTTIVTTQEKPLEKTEFSETTSETNLLEVTEKYINVTTTENIPDRMFTSDTTVFSQPSSGITTSENMTSTILKTTVSEGSSEINTSTSQTISLPKENTELTTSQTTVQSSITSEKSAEISLTTPKTTMFFALSTESIPSEVTTTLEINPSTSEEFTLHTSTEFNPLIHTTESAADPTISQYLPTKETTITELITDVTHPSVYKETTHFPTSKITTTKTTSEMATTTEMSSTEEEMFTHPTLVQITTEHNFTVTNHCKNHQIGFVIPNIKELLKIVDTKVSEESLETITKLFDSSNIKELIKGFNATEILTKSDLLTKLLMFVRFKNPHADINMHRVINDIMVHIPLHDINVDDSDFTTICEDKPYTNPTQAMIQTMPSPHVAKNTQTEQIEFTTMEIVTSKSESVPIPEVEAQIKERPNTTSEEEEEEEEEDEEEEEEEEEEEGLTVYGKKSTYATETAESTKESPYFTEPLHTELHITELPGADLTTLQNLSTDEMTREEVIRVTQPSPVPTYSKMKKQPRITPEFKPTVTTLPQSFLPTHDYTLLSSQAETTFISADATSSDLPFTPDQPTKEATTIASTIDEESKIKTTSPKSTREPHGSTGFSSSPMHSFRTSKKQKQARITPEFSPTIAIIPQSIITYPMPKQETTRMPSLPITTSSDELTSNETITTQLSECNENQIMIRIPDIDMLEKAVDENVSEEELQIVVNILLENPILKLLQNFEYKEYDSIGETLVHLLSHIKDHYTGLSDIESEAIDVVRHHIKFDTKAEELKLFELCLDLSDEELVTKSSSALTTQMTTSGMHSSQQHTIHKYKETTNEFVGTTGEEGNNFESTSEVHCSEDQISVIVPDIKSLLMAVSNSIPQNYINIFLNFFTLERLTCMLQEFYMERVTTKYDTLIKMINFIKKKDLNLEPQVLQALEEVLKSVVLEGEGQKQPDYIIVCQDKMTTSAALTIQTTTSSLDETDYSTITESFSLLPSILTPASSSKTYDILSLLKTNCTVEPDILIPKECPERGTMQMLVIDFVSLFESLDSHVPEHTRNSILTEISKLNIQNELKLLEWDKYISKGELFKDIVLHLTSNNIITSSNITDSLLEILPHITTNDSKDKCPTFKYICVPIDQYPGVNHILKETSVIRISSRSKCQENPLLNAFYTVSISSLLKAVKSTAPRLEKSVITLLFLGNNITGLLTDFDVKQHKTNGELLKALLTHLSSHPSLGGNIIESIHTMLCYVILDGLGALPPEVQLDCEKPETINAPIIIFKDCFQKDSIPTLTIDAKALLEIVKMDTVSEASLKDVENILVNSEVQKYILDIDEANLNKAQILKAILNYSKSYVMKNKQIVRSIDTILANVPDDGNLSVQPGLQVKCKNSTANLCGLSEAGSIVTPVFVLKSSDMFRTLKHDAPEEAVRLIWKYFTQLDFYKSVREFNIENYNTVGELFKGLLEHLLSNTILEEKIKMAMNKLILFIQMDGPGKVKVNHTTICNFNFPLNPKILTEMQLKNCPSCSKPTIYVPENCPEENMVHLYIIDMPSLFEAVKPGISPILIKNVINIIDTPAMQTKLKVLDWDKYDTKAELLIDVLSYVILSSNLPKEITDAMNKIAAYIDVEGHGQEEPIFKFICVPSTQSKTKEPVITKIIPGKCKNQSSNHTAPTLVVNIESLMKAIKPNTPRVPRAIAMALFQQPDFMQLINDFKIDRFRTLGEQLQGLLAYLITKGSLEPVTLNAIKTLLTYVQLDGPGAYAPDMKIVCQDHLADVKIDIPLNSTLISNNTETNRIVLPFQCPDSQIVTGTFLLDLQSLFFAFDSNAPLYLIPRVKNFLQNSTLHKALMNFKWEHYETRGQLLRDVLLLVLKHSPEKNELYKAVDELLPYVLLTGYGSQAPIIKFECDIGENPAIIKHQTHCDKGTTPLYTIETDGLFKTLKLGTDQTAIYIVNKYLTQVDFYKKIYGFNFKNYRTKGEFFQELLAYLLLENSPDPVLIQALSTLIMNVRLDGCGADTVDFKVLCLISVPPNVQTTFRNTPIGEFEKENSKEVVLSNIGFKYKCYPNGTMTFFKVDISQLLQALDLPNIVRSKLQVVLTSPETQNNLKNFDWYAHQENKNKLTRDIFQYLLSFKSPNEEEYSIIEQALAIVNTTQMDRYTISSVCVSDEKEAISDSFKDNVIIKILGGRCLNDAIPVLVAQTDELFTPLTTNASKVAKAIAAAYLRKADFYKSIANFNLTSFKTRGEQLQKLLIHLENSILKNCTLMKATNKLLQNIQMNGPGQLPPSLRIICNATFNNLLRISRNEKKVRESNPTNIQKPSVLGPCILSSSGIPYQIDIPSLFYALKPNAPRASVSTIIEYFTKPDFYLLLQNFDVESQNTNGDLLSSLFKFLAKKLDNQQDILQAIEEVSPFIQNEGPGGNSPNIIPNCSLPGIREIHEGMDTLSVPIIRGPKLIDNKGNECMTISPSMLKDKGNTFFKIDIQKLLEILNTTEKNKGTIVNILTSSSVKDKVNTLNIKKYPSRAELLRGLLSLAEPLNINFMDEVNSFIQNDSQGNLPPVISLVCASGLLNSTFKYLVYATNDLCYMPRGYGITEMSLQLDTDTLLQTLKAEAPSKAANTARSFFKNSNIYMYLQGFNILGYKTQSELMRNLLLFLSSKPEINSEHKKALITLLPFVRTDGPSALPAIIITNCPKGNDTEIDKKDQTSPTHDCLLNPKAIKMTSFNFTVFEALDNSTPNASMKIIYDYISHQDVIITKLYNFKIEKFRTKGDLLQALLAFIWSHPKSQESEKDAAKTLLPHVMFEGSGKQPPDLFTYCYISNGTFEFSREKGLRPLTLVYPVNKTCMYNGTNSHGITVYKIEVLSLFKALKPHIKQNDHLPVSDFLSKPYAYEYIRGINIERYNTRGELLRAVLTFLRFTPRYLEPDVRKSLIKLLPAINMQGPGKHPVDRSVECSPTMTMNSTNFIDLSDLLKSMTENKIDAQVSNSLQTVTEFITSQQFDLQDYLLWLDTDEPITKGQLLKIILLKIMDKHAEYGKHILPLLQYVQENEGIGKEIIAFHSENKENSISSEEIDFLALLHIIKPEAPNKSLNTIFSLFSKDNFHTILEGFDTVQYQTKGELLKGILKYLQTKYDGSSEIGRAVIELIPFVDLENLGALPPVIKKIYITTNTSVNVFTLDLGSLYKVIPRSNLTMEGKVALDTIFKYLSSEEIDFLDLVEGITPDLPLRIQLKIILTKLKVMGDPSLKEHIELLLALLEEQVSGTSDQDEYLIPDMDWIEILHAIPDVGVPPEVIEGKKELYYFFLSPAFKAIIRDFHISLNYNKATFLKILLAYLRTRPEVTRMKAVKNAIAYVYMFIKEQGIGQMSIQEDIILPEQQEEVMSAQNRIKELLYHVLGLINQDGAFEILQTLQKLFDSSTKLNLETTYLGYDVLEEFPPKERLIIILRRIYHNFIMFLDQDTISAIDMVFISLGETKEQTIQSLHFLPIKLDELLMTVLGPNTSQNVSSAAELIGSRVNLQTVPLGKAFQDTVPSILNLRPKHRLAVILRILWRIYMKQQDNELLEAIKTVYEHIQPNKLGNEIQTQKHRSAIIAALTGLIHSNAPKEVQDATRTIVEYLTHQTNVYDKALASLVTKNLPPKELVARALHRFREHQQRLEPKLWAAVSKIFEHVGIPENDFSQDDSEDNINIVDEFKLLLDEAEIEKSPAVRTVIRFLVDKKQNVSKIFRGQRILLQYAPKEKMAIILGRLLRIYREKLDPAVIQAVETILQHLGDSVPIEVDEEKIDVFQLLDSVIDESASKHVIDAKEQVKTKLQEKPTMISEILDEIIIQENYNSQHQLALIIRHMQRKFKLELSKHVNQALMTLLDYLDVSPDTSVEDQFAGNVSFEPLFEKVFPKEEIPQEISEAITQVLNNLRTQQNIKDILHGMHLWKLPLETQVSLILYRLSKHGKNLTAEVKEAVNELLNSLDADPDELAVEDIDESFSPEKLFKQAFGNTKLSAAVQEAKSIVIYYLLSASSKLKDVYRGIEFANISSPKDRLIAVLKNIQVRQGTLGTKMIDALEVLADFLHVDLSKIKTSLDPYTFDFKSLFDRAISYTAPQNVLNAKNILLKAIKKRPGIFKKIMGNFIIEDYESNSDIVLKILQAIAKYKQHKLSPQIKAATDFLAKFLMGLPIDRSNLPILEGNTEDDEDIVGFRMFGNENLQTGNRKQWKRKKSKF